MDAVREKDKRCYDMKILMLILCIHQNRCCVDMLCWCKRVICCLKELIAYLHAQAVPVTGYRNTSPAFVALDVPLSNPPAFPGIPRAGSAIQLQLEFRLAPAQHRLSVYLLMTQPVFYLLGKSACHLWHRNNL